jgi:hypothetical protein
MKKIYVLLIIIMILISACQPTPEEEIVVNKNDGKFQQALEAAPEETAQIDAASQMQETEIPVEYPERWKAEFEKYGGRLKFAIDADVVVSDAKSYPVVTLKPYYVPIEQANKMIETIFGTLDIYCLVYETTKDQIQDMIVQVKADIKKAENDGDEEMAEQYRETLASMTESLKDAPNEAKPRKYSGEFDIYNGKDSEQWSIEVREDPMNVQTPYLGINNTVRSEIGNGYNASVVYGDYSKLQYLFIDETSHKTKYKDNPLFSTDDAKTAVQKANSFLSDIDIKDRVVEQMYAIAVSEGSDEIIGYKIFYGKKFNGITIPRDVQLGGSSWENNIQTQENYVASFDYEALTVDVTYGEVSRLEWQAPYEIDRVLKDDVELMSFDEITSRAETQLAVKYAYLEGQEDESRNLYVDEIILTYAVEPIQNEKYQYMLIPVWAFYGGVDYGEGTEIYGGEIREGRYPYQWSLLTINAVDGSVIFGR